MLDSLEEGQLLEDDPYLSNSMLKELVRFGMEVLGSSLEAELGDWEGLSGYETMEAGFRGGLFS